MPTVAQPVCEARISPELTAMIAAIRGGRPAVDEPAPAEAVGATTRPAGEPAARSPCAPVPGPHWRAIVLRRDGHAPLRFTGALLCEADQTIPVEGPQGEAGPVRRRVALYRRQDGGIVAQIRCLPPEDQPARPVHVAGPVASGGDLARLLARFGARACFAVSPHLAVSATGEEVPPRPFAVPSSRTGD